jgi:hypothetical protein
MSIHSRYVNLPRDKAYEGFLDAVEKYIGQPLPKGTKITGFGPTLDGYTVNIDSPEFGELPPGASHELKPRKK